MNTDHMPRLISCRFLAKNAAEMRKNCWMVDFVNTTIRSLFGFDEKLYRTCLLFSAPDPFRHLWHAAFALHEKDGVIKTWDNEVAFSSIFNYATGERLVAKAQQLILQNRVTDDVAHVLFRSCISTEGFAGFEGYADFDVVTALSILFLKERYPHIHTVKGNLYLGGGTILFDEHVFPVKVESTLDQRFIYGLINGR